MALDRDIIKFAQGPSPLVRGAQAVGNAFEVIGQANRRKQEQEKLNNRRDVFRILGRGFSDQSNPEQTTALINEAFKKDPQAAFEIIQMISENQQGKDFQQVKTKGLEGYTFDPNTGSFSIDPAVKEELASKAVQKAAAGVELNAKDRQGINKDVTSLLKDTSGIVKSAKSLSGLKKSSSPAAKLAAVFSFMKAMDPSSTVRESEQGQVYDAEGAAKGIANKINALLGQGGLSEEGFSDLVDTANNLANSAIEASGSEVMGYLDAFEGTIPEGFKNKLNSRIPEKLAVKESESTSNKRYADNVSKYLKAK